MPRTHVAAGTVRKPVPRRRWVRSSTTPEGKVITRTAVTTQSAAYTTLFS
ncbi:MAG TPA: hypothetical protein VKV57_00455 [bacterium]|nr:hypothetical protein [bacterium]